MKCAMPVASCASLLSIFRHCRPNGKFQSRRGLEKASHELEPVAPTIEIVRSGEDWFELKYSVATGGGRGDPARRGATPAAFRPEPNAAKNGKIAVLNPDALDDFEQVLRDADPRQSQPGLYRLKKIQAGYLTNTAEEIGARLVGASKVLQRRPTNRVPRPARNAVARLPTHRRAVARRARRTKPWRHPGRRDGPRQNCADTGFPSPCTADTARP